MEYSLLSSWMVMSCNNNDIGDWNVVKYQWQEWNQNGKRDPMSKYCIRHIREICLYQIMGLIDWIGMLFLFPGSPWTLTHTILLGLFCLLLFLSFPLLLLKTVNQFV